MIWVDKYKPKSTVELIGQSKNIARIKSWLKTYDRTKSRPLFIYGPPGIGKTTAAHLCCKEIGFKTIEFNASDQRNKNIIKEVISTAMSTSRLNLFGRASETKDCIILDEVDGMAGNEDRGGIAQILIEIKKTFKPIILICNDGQHQKLRTLKDKCEVIEFRRPEYESIRAVVARIARQENLNLDKIDVRSLAESSDYDIRQIVNSLSLFKDSSSSQISKTTRLNAFEATRKVLTASKLTLDERFECFFSDYNIMPLFIFENYLKNRPMKGDHLKAVSRAADSLCLSDLAEKEIRSKQNWSLLNTQALLSTAIPSYYVGSGSFGRADFPQFLGKLSNTNKRMRLTQELNAHMCLTLRAGLDPDYLDAMRERLSSPLIRNGSNGIDSVIDFMHEYSLLRDDFNSIMELSSWSFKPDPMSKVDTKTKTAFTKAYKNRSIAMPYFIEEGKVTKKKKVNIFGDEDEGNEEDDDDDDDDDNITIKPKKVSSVQESKTSNKKTNKQAKEKQTKEEVVRPVKEEQEKPLKAAKKVVMKESVPEKNGKKENGKKENGNTAATKASVGGSSQDGISTNGTNSKADKRPPEGGGIERFFLSSKKQKSTQ